MGSRSSTTNVAPRPSPSLSAHTLAFPVALRPYFALVQLHEVTPEGEAKPQAAMPPRSLVLPEAVEDVREKLGADPLTGIAHREARVRACMFQTQGDTSSVGGELDRVREEVPHHLLQAPGVARNRRSEERGVGKE